MRGNDGKKSEIPFACVLMGALVWAVSPSYAQQLSAYSDWAYDQGSGEVYMVAETWADYSTAYYYDTLVIMSLAVTPRGGSTYYTCQRGATASDAAAHVDCTATVHGDADLQFVTQHEVTATYNVYQFEPFCTWDCYDWWDAFRVSLLGVGGVYIPDSTSWFAPGPPAVSVPQTQTLQAFLSRQGSTGVCPFPTGESSTFFMWSDTYYHAAGFAAALEGDSVYNNRWTYEWLTSVDADTCHQFHPNPQYPPFVAKGGGMWQVGRLRGENALDLGPSHNGYGLDFVGFPDSNAVAFYMNWLRSHPSMVSCGLTYQQQMKIQHCSDGTWRDYGSPNAMHWTIRPYSVELQRGNASASR